MEKFAISRAHNPARRVVDMDSEFLNMVECTEADQSLQRSGYDIPAQGSVKVPNAYEEVSIFHAP